MAVTKPKKRDSGLKRALPEVLKSVKFNKRHLLFYVVLFLFVAALTFVIKNSTNLFASNLELAEESAYTGESGYTVDITVDHYGQAKVDDKTKPGLIKPLTSFDEFKYKVFNKPGTFVDQLTILVHFENELPADTKLQSFAVHGIDSATEEQVDGNTIRYSATGIGPEAEYTVAAQLPPGSIAWPTWKKLGGIISGMPVWFWIGLAIILPLAALAMIIAMFRSRIKSFVKGEPSAESQTNQLPEKLSPAMVGILVHGRVSSREIAATLVDLAQRGYITLFDKGEGQFAFAKRRPWQGLQSFELTLLSQMFDNPSYKASNGDIEVAVGAELFSKKVTKVYLSMYDEITKIGYFEHNPAAVHSRYRFTGLVLFFVGLLAMITTLLFNLEPAFIIFFFAGLMMMALVIIFAADSVPLRTKAGEEARLRWLTFQNYLAAPEQLGYIEGAQDFYERYLPYAITLKVETNWVHRFQNFPFKIPDWYGSTSESPTIETFANSLYDIVGSVGQLFSSSKEPTIH